MSMVPSSNGPAVDLSTRKWLDGLVIEGALLDAASRSLMERAITKCLRVTPCGLVHDVARGLGAPPDLALLAGSVSEVFYAVCSLTDDLQDGDAEPYLGPIPPALAWNMQSHLLCLLAVRANELASKLKETRRRDLVTKIYATGAAMLLGQRLELTRDSWTIETYEKVARLSAGEQFGLHLLLGALAADVEPEPLRRWGRAFGTLLQLVADVESQDSRLVRFPTEERGELCSRLTRELERASLGLEDRVREHAQWLIARCHRVTR